ncbi:MAG: DUF4136 domain-containing protein [Phenylobacterium sp.]
MNRRSIALVLAALALSACASTPTVTSDTTPGANFANYKTYTWVNPLPPAGMNPVAFERIRQGIDGALSAKGYSKADPGDLSVILTLGARDKTDVTTWGRFGQQVDIYNYTEGKLSVDIFDTKTKQPLWHGSATQTIDPGKSDPAMIDAAVSGVMAKFPGHG